MKNDKQILKDAMQLFDCMYQLDENTIQDWVKVKTYDIWFDKVKELQKEYSELLVEQEKRDKAAGKWTTFLLILSTMMGFMQFSLFMSRHTSLAYVSLALAVICLIITLIHIFKPSLLKLK